MDINLDDFPTVICSCSVLHNYCEINKESISDEQVRTTKNSERESQPRNQRATQGSMSNESEGKRARRVITKYFDP